MTQSVSAKKAMANGNQKKSNGSADASAKTAGRTSPKPTQARKGQGSRLSTYAAPSWLGALVSVIGVGVAIGAGLYATRDQWMPTAEKWKDDFSAAFADDETDSENFDHIIKENKRIEEENARAKSASRGR